MILLSTLTLGLLDSLNPSTILTTILILLASKTNRQAYAFIFGTICIYTIFGLIIHFGNTVYFSKIISSWFTQFKFEIGIFEIFLALICFLVSCYYSYRLSRHHHIFVAKEAKIPRIIGIPQMFGFAVICTLSDLPTAIPYFGFLSFLERANLHELGSVVFIFLYCLLYVLPLIVLALLYQRVSASRFHVVQENFMTIVNRYTPWILIICGFLASFFFIYDGIHRIGLVLF